MEGGKWRPEQKEETEEGPQQQRLRVRMIGNDGGAVQRSF
jgi:hypothetical protein